jgi:hypothetical protein
VYPPPPPPNKLVQMLVSERSPRPFGFDEAESAAPFVGDFGWLDELDELLAVVEGPLAVIVKGWPLPLLFGAPFTLCDSSVC